MYDAVYEGLGDTVDVVVHADHLRLNQHVAELLAAGERLDVISTHGKYAPSQRRWLHPLDGLLDPAVVAALEPGAVALCRDRGDLLCAPRNIDVRVLWWRADRLDTVPDTWAELVDSDARFGFTGRGSGLFGMFFEHVVGCGGRLFTAGAAPGTIAPALDPNLARQALETIAALGRRGPGGPEGLTSWQYDAVDAALGAGTIDCAASWPGATATLRSSPAGAHLRPAPYPAGTVRRVSYSGCHGWAIPMTCGDLDGAVALVEHLCSAEPHQREAALGGIPAHTAVLAGIEPLDEIDARRLDITRRMVAEAMITYPGLERFPRLEERGSAAITAVLAGESPIDEAAAVIDTELAAVLRRGPRRRSAHGH